MSRRNENRDAERDEADVEIDTPAPDPDADDTVEFDEARPEPAAQNPAGDAIERERLAQADTSDRDPVDGQQEP